MYGPLALLDKDLKLEKRGERVNWGDLPGINEAWLRDTLFQNPEIIPIDDIDQTFSLPHSPRGARQINHCLFLDCTAATAIPVQSE
jgi:hypothetical protein